MLVGPNQLLFAMLVLAVIGVTFYTMPRHGPQAHPAFRWQLLEVNSTQCKNTVQGAVYITDERGM